MKEVGVFPNLKAEQARQGHTNQFVGAYLGMSRSNFENKLRTGRFRVKEAKKLCELYGCDFNYLFADAPENRGA